jgi:hypothetical protein
MTAGLLTFGREAYPLTLLGIQGKISPAGGGYAMGTRRPEAGFVKVYATPRQD